MLPSLAVSASPCIRGTALIFNRCTAPRTRLYTMQKIVARTVTRCMKKNGRERFLNIHNSSLGAAIDSDVRVSETGPEDLVNYVFQILYDTEDTDEAIRLLLEIIGKRFDVSRAYIFENTDDGKYCDNTYEWCSEGILPEKEMLQHVSYEDLDSYADLFKEDAVFYCRDISKLTSPAQIALFERQHICSTLQCAMMENSSFVGFIGFDECTGNQALDQGRGGNLIENFTDAVHFFCKRNKPRKEIIG